MSLLRRAPIDTNRGKYFIVDSYSNPYIYPLYPVRSSKINDESRRHFDFDRSRIEIVYLKTLLPIFFFFYVFYLKIVKFFYDCDFSRTTFNVSREFSSAEKN